MKKTLSFFLIFTLLTALLLTPTASAQSAPIKVKLDGTHLTFQVPPTVIGGRTMVPVRDIFEALGIAVGWDDNTKTVIGTRSDLKIILPLNQKTASINGKEIQLDAPATSYKGKTVVPVRFIAESTGARVYWHKSHQTVVIISNPEEIIKKNAESDTVTFLDPNLQEAIETRYPYYKELGFKKENMKYLRSLYISGFAISDAEGLQYFMSLESLGLNDNNLEDISPLGAMSNLQKVYLGYNRIASIEPLRGLTRLQEIHLSKNRIKDIRPLSDLKKVTWITLSDNQIEDVGPLQYLKALKSLHISGNRITDLNPLAALPQLETLILDSNKIQDIKPVGQISSLKSLYLSHNQIKDVSPLTALSNLTELRIGYNGIVDVSSVSKLKQLKTLDIRHNKIRDIRSLETLKGLTYLDGDDNPFDDVKVLTKLPNLTYVTIWGLRDLKQIQSVDDKTSLIIKQVTKSGMTELQREKAVHDYVVKNVAYDYDNYLRGTIPVESGSAYGALVKGKAVCGGYAHAMYILLMKAGLEVQIVGGDANSGGWGAHAWNIVKIGGKYYHVDATWDDPVPDVAGRVRYDYFNRSDKEMEKDHRWDRTNVPKCESTMKLDFRK